MSQRDVSVAQFFTTPLVGNERIPTVRRAVQQFAAIEFLALSGTAFVASLVYNYFVLNRIAPLGQYLPASLLLCSLLTLVAVARHSFDITSFPSRKKFLAETFIDANIAFAFFVCIMFLFKAADEYSRGTFICQYASILAVSVGLRSSVVFLLRGRIEHGQIIPQQLLCLSLGEETNTISEALSEGWHTSARSVFLDHRIFATSSADHADLAAGCEEVTKLCRRARPDAVVIDAPSINTHALKTLVQHLAQLPLGVHLSAPVIQSGGAGGRIIDLGSTRLLQILRPPLSPLAQVGKRVFDFVGAALALLILSPLLAAVALAIKLDSRGPALFRQTRHGFNDDVIRVFKFRSMTSMEDGAAFRQATKNDLRITRVGRVLRKTNIDELPQLFNVLSGEMSLVGPRPHPVALNESFNGRVSFLARRHKVKPGITGWAQVNGFRGETDTLEKMHERIRCDVYYIDNWSFFLDLKILFLTLFSARAYRGAG